MESDLDGELVRREQLAEFVRGCGCKGIGIALHALPAMLFARQQDQRPGSDNRFGRVEERSLSSGGGRSENIPGGGCGSEKDDLSEPGKTAA